MTAFLGVTVTEITQHHAVRRRDVNDLAALCCCDRVRPDSLDVVLDAGDHLLSIHDDTHCFMLL